MDITPDVFNKPYTIKCYEGHYVGMNWYQLQLRQIHDGSWVLVDEDANGAVQIMEHTDSKEKALKSFYDYVRHYNQD